MDKLGTGKADTRAKTHQVVVLIVMPCLAPHKGTEPPHTMLTNQNSWNPQVFVWELLMMPVFHTPHLNHPLHFS